MEFWEAAVTGESNNDKVATKSIGSVHLGALRCCNIQL